MKQVEELIGELQNENLVDDLEEEEEGEDSENDNDNDNDKDDKGMDTND